MTSINSIKELKKISMQEHGLEVFILLKNGLKSSKFIKWFEKEQKFKIINYVDDTTQILTDKEIKNKYLTNIGNAIKRRMLFISEIE